MTEWEIVKQTIHSSLNIERELWAAFEGCRVLEAYTDGSAPIRNPGGPAGFAAIVIGYPELAQPDAPHDITPYARLELGGYIPKRIAEPLTSNNRAELAGVLAALEAIRQLVSTSATIGQAAIWSDSSYVVNCANGVWQRKKNTDLWPVLDRLAQEVRQRIPNGLTIRWQKGHAGHQYNEAADELASRAAFNFDDIAYKRFRAAQVKTGREMPGAKALDGQSLNTGGSEKLEGQTGATPGHKIVKPDDWLTGSDYTLVLFSHNGSSGQSKGQYCLFAKDGRNRQTQVDHSGERGPDETEYLTLIVALRHISERITSGGRDTSAYSLTIHSRMELMVKQLRGEYRVKSPALQYTYAEASDLISRFKSVEIVCKRGAGIEELFRG